MGHTAVVPSEKNMVTALKMLHEADRPFIVMGHGAVGPQADVIALAEKLGAPVATTFKDKRSRTSIQTLPVFWVAPAHRSPAGS